MAYNLYEGPVLTLKAILKDVTHLVQQAEKQPNADALLKARLHEDMKPFTFQVHTVTRFTDLALARLSGKEFPEYTDDFTSYADLYARIDKVSANLEAADEATVVKYGEESAMTPLPSASPKDITGKAFVNGVAMPNIFFHLSMTYAVLRKEGVPLGKADYIMPFVTQYLQ